MISVKIGLKVMNKQIDYKLFNSVELLDVDVAVHVVCNIKLSLKRT